MQKKEQYFNTVQTSKLIIKKYVKSFIVEQNSIYNEHSTRPDRILETGDSSSDFINTLTPWE
jgi:hypothetical protein